MKHDMTRRPNIIMVLADDLGWSELESYGNTFNETPCLNRLAEEGMRFTHAYASAPVCSPYRAEDREAITLLATAKPGEGPPSRKRYGAAGLGFGRYDQNTQTPCGNPVSPPARAGETVRHAVGGAGVRGRKKQMPSRNRTNTSPAWLERKRGPRPAGIQSREPGTNRRKVGKADDSEQSLVRPTRACVTTGRLVLT